MWSEPKAEQSASVLERVGKNSVETTRRLEGREAHTSCRILEAHSLHNSDTAAAQGGDGGTWVSGMQRPLAVDTHGWPQAMVVTTAQVSDRHGACQMGMLQPSWRTNVRKVLADGGDTGAHVARATPAMLGCTVAIAQRNARPTCAVLPKRGVVERAGAWLAQCRRLWKNCARKLHTSLPMTVRAFLALLLKRL